MRPDCLSEIPVETREKLSHSGHIIHTQFSSENPTPFANHPSVKSLFLISDIDKTSIEGSDEVISKCSMEQCGVFILDMKSSCKADNYSGYSTWERQHRLLKKGRYVYVIKKPLLRYFCLKCQKWPQYPTSAAQWS